MAEQCIVCLDQLRAVEPPPPPPLPGDSANPPKNSSTNTRPATVDDSAAAPSIGLSGPSTGVNGHSYSGSNDADVVGEAHSRDTAASKDAVTGIDSSNDHEETHDDDLVAVIQICKHTLHDTCLREWTTKANSCPICRQSFHLVDVYDKIGGKLLSTYTVEDKKQVAEFDPQPWLDETEVLDDEISTPCPSSLGGSNTAHGSANRRAGASRSRNFFPRTRHTMRRARRRARSDEWQGAWSQITGHVWDAIHIDLDHDEDEALEEFRRIERLHDQERREFERWQERLDIARRLGAQEIFERNIPAPILNHAARHSTTSPSSSSNPRTVVAAVQQSQQERRAWGDFDRALECDSTVAATPSSRKRKSRSHTASPIEPPREQEQVEMGTSSDDDNIRSLFGDPPFQPVDPASPVGSSPAASAHNSPRAMSTTPPPQRTLRPSSPTLLSSHILPVYPPANYSPTRPSASSNGAGAGSGAENSDSEGSAHTHNHTRRTNRNSIANGHANTNVSSNNNSSAQQLRSPGTVEIRQPRPRRMSSAAAVTRSLDSSPTRNALSLEMKESISSVVRSALKPHWKSSHLTADQYAAINRDVSRKLYEEVTNPSIVDTEVRRLWEQKANREVARAVADLQV
ncbi:hypothetical protein SCUCBS95973_001707 [Sporothrix curviconia]|uniref:RING-type domain-containing protein n=1 Tax=Sporothrix curviconia TaxID=1260050 RepID=A0ABP0B0U2_9PEZI